MPKPVKRFWSRVTKTIFPKLKLAAHDPMQYVGKTVLAQKEFDQPFEEIKIRDVKGSIRYEKYFEINGTHWVSMISFFTQMLYGRFPTKDEANDFEEATRIKVIEEIGSHGTKEVYRNAGTEITTGTADASNES